MSRDFQIPGQALVLVKGASGTALGSLVELGLATDQIQVNFTTYHRNLVVNTWGQAPPEVQYMNEEAVVSMNLIHFDQAVLAACILESKAGASAYGRVGMAGARMGNGAARFAATNHYIGLNITAPIQGLPYRFYYAFITGSTPTFPLGVESQVVTLSWRVIPYTQDPWGAGFGSLNSVLFDNTLDT